MPPNLEKGISAKFKYHEVRYSHIPIEPGESAVLTADPWSFLHSVILQKINKSRGDNKKRFSRANYYARLAEDFYKAAEGVQLPTKGTLLYYGMLNLVKCFLSTTGTTLEISHEHHGLALPLGSKYKVQIQPPLRNGINIFAEFAKALGTPVKARHEIELKDVFSNIPELHGLCAELNFIRRKKYLPIKIEFLVNSTYEWLFTEVVYDKKHEQPLLTSRFLKGEKERYFKKGYPRDGKIVYRSRRRKRVNKENWPIIYKNIINEYSKFNICSILTRSGYSYYCDLSPGHYHHLCNSLLAMFYIGTAARYRPSEVNEAMGGEWRPLVTETSSVTPKQFLYQIVSLTTKKLCVIPFAAI